MDAEDVYAFRHPLTRDAAYQMQLPSVRAELHWAASQVISAGAARDTVAGVIDAVTHATAATSAPGASSSPERLAAELDLLRHARSVLDRETLPDETWGPVTNRLIIHPLSDPAERLVALWHRASLAMYHGDERTRDAAISAALALADDASPTQREQYRARIHAWLLRSQARYPASVAQTLDPDAVTSRRRPDLAKNPRVVIFPGV
jgi:hypothetical protein